MDQKMSINFNKKKTKSVFRKQTDQILSKITFVIDSQILIFEWNISKNVVEKLT